MKQHKLIKTGVIVAIAVAVMAGGYFGFRAAIGAAMRAPESQTITTTTTPADTDTADSSAVPAGHIDLTVVQQVGAPTPDPQYLTADQAAQWVASLAQDAFGIDAQGATVQMTFQPRLDSFYNGTEAGQVISYVVVSGYDQAADPGIVNVTFDVLPNGNFPGASASWYALLTTANGEQITANIDAVTGWIVYNMASAFPTLSWNCSDDIAGSSDSQDAAMQFVRMNLKPAYSITGAKTVCAAEGYEQVAVTMSNGLVYLVSVDTNHTVYAYQSPFGTNPENGHTAVALDPLLWTCDANQNALGSSRSQSQQAAIDFVAGLGPVSVIQGATTTCVNKVDGSEKVQVAMSDGSYYLVYVNNKHVAVSAWFATTS